MVDLKIKISEDIIKRAIDLIDKIAFAHVEEFIDTFGIHTSIQESYFIKHINQVLAEGNTNQAATLIIQKKLFKHFDLVALVEKLAKKGQSNRKIAIELLDYCPEMMDKLII